MKLCRAKEHIDTVESEFAAQVEDDAYEPSHQMDLQTGQYWINLELPPPGPYLGTMLGDFAHNARSALDHLMWALVLANRGGIEPPNPNEIAFPICDSPGWFKGRAVLKYLTHEQRALTESLRSYLRWPEFKHPPLAFLRDLSNADKHRTLAVLARGIWPEDKPVISKEPTFYNCGRLLDPHYVLSHGVVENGAMLAHFRSTELRPDSYVDMQFQVTVEPALRLPGDRMMRLFPAADNAWVEVFRVLKSYEGLFPPDPDRGEYFKRLTLPRGERWEAHPAASRRTSTQKG